MVDYCEVDDVKPVLQIDVADTTFNDELADCVTSGSALIDGFLKAEGLVVPGTASFPQLVVDAAKYFAAWGFRRPRDPVDAEAFWVEANRFLQSYIDAESAPYVGVA